MFIRLARCQESTMRFESILPSDRMLLMSTISESELVRMMLA